MWLTALYVCMQVDRAAAYFSLITAESTTKQQIMQLSDAEVEASIRSHVKPGRWHHTEQNIPCKWVLSCEYYMILVLLSSSQFAALSRTHTC
jgi:hypothetical protein